jgi:hypothetical protein
MRSASSSVSFCSLLLLTALCAALPACMEGPENGDVVTGTTQGKGLNFSGKHDKPGMQIRVQVMKAPDDPNQSSPLNTNNWVTIATAVSSTTADFWPADDIENPYYSWSVGAVAVSNSTLLARWPQGGIMRFRALDADNKVLYTFDQDRTTCYLNNASGNWKAIGLECTSEFSTAAVVSPTPTPADLAVTPKYLSFNGTGSIAETIEYYGEIGAPATLPAFKQKYGFGAAGSDEATATYFNAGDLGIGREMHCKSFVIGASSGRACYVSNYGDGVVNFGADPAAAVAKAVTGAKSGIHTGAFATVAMVYTAPISAANSVQFMVYGPNDQRVNEAQLDSKGYNKGIPQNCVTCHGGATYDSAANSVTGARFLAFDTDIFSYSTDAGFTLAAQQEGFRKLNRHVYNAAPSAATKELIEGWYAAGSVNTVGTVQDTSFVPSTFAVQKEDKKFYQGVVAPYCRGCHAAQSALSFTSSDDFKGLGFLIDFRVCATDATGADNHLMPNAEVTLKRFWSSPARAYLAGYLDSTGSCKP